MAGQAVAAANTWRNGVTLPDQIGPPGRSKHHPSIEEIGQRPLPWFRLDDSFHSHPKILMAGNEAVGLYVRCGTYAAQHLTNGFIPDEVALLYGTCELAEVLVRTKLWRRTRGGWQMPDYLEYNPSRETVDNERRANAERQKRWRKAHP